MKGRTTKQTKSAVEKEEKKTLFRQHTLHLNKADNNSSSDHDVHETLSVSVFLFRAPLYDLNERSERAIRWPACAIRRKRREFFHFTVG